jgi:hypothetical protein
VRCGSVLAGNFTETALGEISFPEISAPILEKICEYFYYKLRYQNEYVPVPAIFSPDTGTSWLCW